MPEFDDVKAFHQKFDLIWHPDGSAPVHLTPQKIADRVNFMLEELGEFVNAAGTVFIDFDSDKAEPYCFLFSDRNQSPPDLPKMADALVDLVYVALGTAVQLGLPWAKLWDDVHAANMRKVRGSSTRNYIDVIKPPGWVGPKGEAILAEVGYRPEHWREHAGIDDATWWGAQGTLDV